MGLLLERDVDINIYDWVRRHLLALGASQGTKSVRSAETHPQASQSSQFLVFFFFFEGFS